MLSDTVALNVTNFRINFTENWFLYDLHTLNKLIIDIVLSFEKVIDYVGHIMSSRDC